MMLWLLACGLWADPLEQELAHLESQRLLLRAAESAMVTERLARAREAQSPIEEEQALVLARRLGLDVPDPRPATVAPLDGREMGVTLAHGQAILAGVRQEYRGRVDEESLGRATGVELGQTVNQDVETALTAAIAGGMSESEAVVRGVEAALIALDPYTTAIWPAQVAQWSAHHEGVQLGVGMTLDATSDGRVVVSALNPWGPAHAQDLHQGDVLKQLGDAAVTSVGEAQRSLAGEPGTVVKVTAVRGEEELAVSLTRAAVPEETVFGWQRKSDHGFTAAIEPDVAYARLTAFRGDTDESFVNVAGVGPWKAVILDLRSNGGGDVQAALNVLDQWFDDGTLVTMEGRAAPVPEPPGPGEAAWNEGTPGGAFVDVCTAVLVDADTASAAEIVVGVLQLHGARVFGAQTLGKGSSQALRADDALGVAWQVTNLAWALPDGRVLTAGNGIVPDEEHIPTPAESWQTARLAAIREAPRVHADGSPMLWLGPRVADGMIALDGDPMLTRARLWVHQTCL